MNPGDKPTPPAEFARLREGLWRDRGAASGLCLGFAAHQVAAADPARARTLAALGFVRARWEAVRCAAPEPGGQGYRFMLSVIEAGVEMQDPAVHQPASAWRAAIKQAAQDPATYVYAINMAKVCGSAAVRPEAEWPELRDKLQAAIVKAAEASAP